MNNAISQIFLYLACIYCINALLINAFRRLKLADFIAHILTGVLFAIAIAGWGKIFGPETVRPFESGFKITEQTLANLRSIDLPDTLLEKAQGMKDRVYTGEGTFLDSLAASIGVEEAARYKSGFVKYAPFNDKAFAALILFLTQLGVLLFLMQLGFNFDYKFFQLSNRIILSQAGIVLLLNVLVLGLGSYFILFNQTAWPAIFLIIAFLSINVGAVLSSNFPMSLSIKKPLKNLVQMAVVLDIFAIAFFTFVTLYFQYKNYDWSNLLVDIPSWMVIILFIMPVVFPAKTEKLFESSRKVVGEFTVLLKLGVFFLFLYIGYRSGLSVLLLGVWAGLIFKTFAGSLHFEVHQKFFSNISFLYIFPFVEIGRDLFLPREYSLEFWFHLCIILLALALISLLIALFLGRKKDYSLIMSVGAFPRGELTVLILWLFKEIYFIPSSIFIASVIVVILTSLLGSLLGRLLFIHSIERQKKLNQR